MRHVCMSLEITIIFYLRHYVARKGEKLSTPLCVRGAVFYVCNVRFDSMTCIGGTHKRYDVLNSVSGIVQTRTHRSKSNVYLRANMHSQEHVLSHYDTSHL